MSPLPVCSGSPILGVVGLARLDPDVERMMASLTGRFGSREHNR
jgi:hypothetical protein